MSDILGICVRSLECEEEQSAWESFDFELKIKLKWTRGYKYWRSAPDLLQDKDFSTNCTTFVVRARLTASIKPFKGLKQVSSKKPYPTKEEIESFEANIGIKERIY